MWRQAHPLVVQFIQHERGREWTFRNGHAASKAQCHARAGLFQNQDGEVQCAYCYEHWTSDTQGETEGHMDPVLNHLKRSPNCPLLRGSRVLNFGATDNPTCCTQHVGLFQNNQRMSLTSNPQGHAGYILTLTTILMYLNILPIYFINAETTITPINTWKGLIGIKRDSQPVPEKYAHYWATLSFSECDALESEIHSLLTLGRDTIQDQGVNPTTGYTPVFKNNSMSYLEMVRGRVNQKGIQSIASLWDEEKPDQAINNCTDLVQLVGGDECKEYQLKTAIGKGGALVALRQAGNTLGALEMIDGLVNHYLEELEKPKAIINQVRNGKMPPEIPAMFRKPSCSEVWRTCAAGANSESPLNKWTKVIATNKLQGTPFRIGLKLATPCMTNEATIHRYAFMPLPYREEDGTIKILNFTSTTVGIKFDQGTNATWKIVPLPCPTAEEGLFTNTCNGTEPRQPLSLKGNEDQVTVTADEKPFQSKFQIGELKGNMFILFVRQQMKAIIQCPQVMDKVLTLAGTMLLQLEALCLAKIPEIPLTLQAKRIPGGPMTTPDGKQPPVPLIIYPKHGKLQPWYDTPTKAEQEILVVAHIMRYAVEYIGVGTTIAAILILGTIIMCVRSYQFRRIPAYVTTNRA